MDKIMRFQIADYLNIGTEETPDYAFLGAGFNTLDETVGAQTDSKIYINDKTATTTVKSYQTEFPYDTDMVKDEKAGMALYAVGRDHKTGSDAEFDYVRVDLYDPVPDKTNLFKARKFRVAAVVSDSKGNGGEVMVNTGTLSCVGDPVQGYFNTVTKKFGKTVEEVEDIAETLGTLTVSSVAGTSTGDTKITITENKLDSSNTYVYKVGTDELTVTLDQDCSLLDSWDGTSDITAATGDVITIVEVDSSKRAKAVGHTTVTAQA